MPCVHPHPKPPLSTLTLAAMRDASERTNPSLPRSPGALFVRSKQPRSKPSCCPLPVEPSLGFLVALIAEVPVDPFDHRHRGSRHPGNQEHVHARHEHPNPVQPRSNPTRPRFSERRIFRDSDFFELFSQPPWESRKVEHKQKGNDGGLKLAPPLGQPILYKKTWKCFNINSAEDPLLPSPLNSLVSSDGGRNSCRLSTADCRPMLAFDRQGLKPGG